MSSDLLTPPAGPGALAACMAELSSGHEELVCMVGETFDRLQALAGNLAKRQFDEADRQRVDERTRWRKELRAMRRSIENLVDQLERTTHAHA
jgi:hypothetical protein